MTSFAISPGVRDDTGAWTPDQLAKLLAYTASVGGSIAAAEFFNEPNLAVIGGAPRATMPQPTAATSRVPAVHPQGRAWPAGPRPRIRVGRRAAGELPRDQERRHADGDGPGVDVFSYHFYGGVSKRCAGEARQAARGQTSPEAALSEEWLSRTERDARFYAALRDRFEPGRPLWLTETGETGLRRQPLGLDVHRDFRYVEQLGRLAKLGVQVVMHNTLAASDYALIDEETLEPRPSYWAALLWRRLMGTTVLDAGPSPAPGVHVYRALPGRQAGWRRAPGRQHRTSAARDLAVPMRGERYTLASARGSWRTRWS